MNEPFVIRENFERRPPAHDNRNFWIESCGWHLHSNGMVYLRAPEFFPTRKDAEAVLAKYPDAKIPKPERKWKSGDVFEVPGLSSRMIYIRHFPDFQNECGSTFCLSRCGCDMGHKGDNFLKDAKFLFNVNDYLKQMAKDAEPKMQPVSWL